MSDPSGQVSALLQHWVQGDEKALRALIPMVYKELRRLAHYHLKSERAGHTLQSTALIHEVYLRMTGGQPAKLQIRAQRWPHMHQAPRLRGRPGVSGRAPATEPDA